ncbi:MAG TPA: cation:proton antiporter [Candidatus Limiplasma sp.]|nr:cation:proton antiporter [Candidatus Limiplasma sp.]
MLSYEFLLDLALILLFTKVLGMFTRKLHMPQVVGALLAGVVLGPSVLNLLHDVTFLKKSAELGVVVLMFNAGLNTDLDEMKHAGKASFIVAVIGVLVPLAGGFGIACLFNKGEFLDVTTSVFLQNMFIGVILTATSVSITVETLRELGKLSTPVGSAILGAALIDDIIGIIALTVIASTADASVNIFLTLLKILLFFVFVAIAGYIFYKLFIYFNKRNNRDLRRYVILSFAFCLLMAFSAEHFFGVADITGAFFAGLIISHTERTKYLANRFSTLSYILLSPIFFASLGLSVDLGQGFSGPVLVFSIALLVVAILTKVVGCGLGARLCGYTGRESVQIGVGMMTRGEVALIIAQKGAALGLLSTAFFGPIIIMVIATAVITPIFLKVAFCEPGKGPGGKLMCMLRPSRKLVASPDENPSCDITPQG